MTQFTRVMKVYLLFEWKLNAFVISNEFIHKRREKLQQLGANEDCLFKLSENFCSLNFSCHDIEEYLSSLTVIEILIEVIKHWFLDRIIYFLIVNFQSNFISVKHLYVFCESVHSPNVYKQLLQAVLVYSW